MAVKIKSGALFKIIKAGFLFDPVCAIEKGDNVYYFIYIVLVYINSQT